MTMDLDPIEIARIFTAREREIVSNGLCALLNDAKLLTERPIEEVDARHMRDIIQTAQDLHRYLLRIEAWEELKP